MSDERSKTWLRIDGVTKKTSTSRAWFLAEVAAGRAPSPLKITSKMSVWPEQVIDDWMADREARAKAQAQEQLAMDSATTALPAAHSGSRGGRPRKGASVTSISNA